MTPLQRTFSLVLAAVLLAVILAAMFGCATNPDGTMTDQSKANLIALEQFALATAVQVGTQYIATGAVDQTTVVNSINSGAAVLGGVISTQNIQTPQNAAVATEVAITAKPNKVTKKIAKPIAAKVDEAVKKGATPKQAMDAASKGLKKGAEQLKK